MRFFGGPADGVRAVVPGGIRTVQVHAILPAGVAVAVYTRHELADGPAMVCPGAWPLARE